MAYSSRMSGMVSDYAQFKTVPALVSTLFIMLSMYQFGGIDPVTFNWGLNYTFQPSHAALGSLGAYMIAFMSIDTKDFQYYETWEQVLIAAGPVVIFGWHYIPAIETWLLKLGDPLGAQLAFLLGVVSWIVGMR